MNVYSPSAEIIFVSAEGFLFAKRPEAGRRRKKCVKLLLKK
jgi:hypothetical protein